MKRLRGFTIVELLVVIAVIGILTSVTIVGYATFQSNARDHERSSQVASISAALEKYYDNNGEYPSCNSLTQAATTVTSSVLPGLDAGALVAPKATSGTTNSISCTQSPDTTHDVFYYQGAGSTACVNGTAACLQYTLTYYGEQASATVAVSGVHTIANNVSLVPSGITLAKNGRGKVVATVASVGGANSYGAQCASNSSFTGTTFTGSSSTTSVSVSGMADNQLYYCRGRAIFNFVPGDWMSTSQSITTAQLVMTKTSFTCSDAIAISGDGTHIMCPTITPSNGMEVSTDGGNTWALKTLPGSPYYIPEFEELGGVCGDSLDGNDLALSANGTIGLYGDGSTLNGTGYVYVSQDGGNTWTQTTTGKRSHGGVTMSSDGTTMYFAQANSGYIYKSTNYGGTWTAVTSTAYYWSDLKVDPTGTTLFAERSPSSGSSCAATFYYSLNGGSTFTSQTASTSSLWGFKIATQNGTIYAIAPYGISSNDGASWTATGLVANGYAVGTAATPDGASLFRTQGGTTNQMQESNDLGATWYNIGTNVCSTIGNYTNRLETSNDGTRLIELCNSGGDNYGLSFYVGTWQ